MNLSLHIEGYDRLQKMVGWQEVLMRNLHVALESSVEYLLEPTAVNYMYAQFKAPNGGLEGNFSHSYTDIANGVQAIVGNDLPYAWRREEGFSGKTDSMGRYFADDPGIHYMSYSLQENTTTITQQVELAVQLSLQELGGTP